MKKLLIVLSILISLSAKAGDTSSITTKQVYEDVKAGFGKLVTTLEGPAKHTYEVFVKQQQAEAIADLVAWGLITIAFSVILIISYRKSEWNDGPANAAAAGVIIFGILETILAIGFTITTSWAIPCLINPEYAAIKDIISIFK